MHFGPLQEFAGIGARDKIGGGREVIFAAVDFAGTRLARSGRDRQPDAGFEGEQGVDEGGFTGAGRGGDDEEGAGEGGDGHKLT